MIMIYYFLNGICYYYYYLLLFLLFIIIYYYYYLLLFIIIIIIIIYHYYYYLLLLLLLLLHQTFLAHTPACAESDLNAAAAAPSQSEVTDLNCSDHSTSSILLFILLFTKDGCHYV